MRAGANDRYLTSAEGHELIGRLTPYKTLLTKLEGIIKENGRHFKMSEAQTLKDLTDKLGRFLNLDKSEVRDKKTSEEEFGGQAIYLRANFSEEHAKNDILLELKSLFKIILERKEVNEVDVNQRLRQLDTAWAALGNTRTNEAADGVISALTKSWQSLRKSPPASPSPESPKQTTAPASSLKKTGLFKRAVQGAVGKISKKLGKGEREASPASSARRRSISDAEGSAPAAPAPGKKRS